MAADPPLEQVGAAIMTATKRDRTIDLLGLRPAPIARQPGPGPAAGAFFTTTAKSGPGANTAKAPSWSTSAADHERSDGGECQPRRSIVAYRVAGVARPRREQPDDLPRADGTPRMALVRVPKRR